MRLAGYRIEVDVPDGWDARIYKRPEGDPTLHAGNFPLPVDDGDFGTGAVSSMGADGAFFVLTEYDPKLAGKGLFAPQGLPVPLQESQANPRELLRQLPGQAGIQRFFTTQDRAFCLYVVVGSVPSHAALVAKVNRVLRSVSVHPPEDGHA